MIINSLSTINKSVVYMGHTFNIPKHHHFMAIDSDGDLFSYASEPRISISYELWGHVQGDSTYIGHVSDFGDWKETLRHFKGE